MPGRRRLRAGSRRIGEEIEGQVSHRGSRIVLDRQTKAQQRVEEPMLGCFELAPGAESPGIAEVRDDAVVPAARAIAVGRIGVEQPIAGIERRVGAESVGLAVTNRPPPLAIGLDRAEHECRRQVAEPVVAALALVVLEIKDLATMLALEFARFSPKSEFNCGRHPKLRPCSPRVARSAFRGLRCRGNAQSRRATPRGRRRF